MPASAHSSQCTIISAAAAPAPSRPSFHPDLTPPPPTPSVVPTACNFSFFSPACMWCLTVYFSKWGLLCPSSPSTHPRLWPILHERICRQLRRHGGLTLPRTPPAHQKHRTQNSVSCRRRRFDVVAFVHFDGVVNVWRTAPASMGCVCEWDGMGWDGHDKHYVTMWNHVMYGGDKWVVDTFLTGS
ncbi:hypothetical protein SLA2020_523430 [Shorea laevis]